MSHYLNSFHGKPAMPKFDRPFTSSHRSSEIIATITGALLHSLTKFTSCCPWLAHLASGPIWLLPFSHSFSLCLRLSTLACQTLSCEPIIQKVRYSYLPLDNQSQDLFHTLFQLSLTVLFHYRCGLYFSYMHGSPLFRYSYSLGIIYALHIVRTTRGLLPFLH